MIRIISVDEDFDGAYHMTDDCSGVEFKVDTRPGHALNYDAASDMVICPWRRERVALSIILENFRRANAADRIVDNIRAAWSPDNSMEEQR